MFRRTIVGLFLSLLLVAPAAASPAWAGYWVTTSLSASNVTGTEQGVSFTASGTVQALPTWSWLTQPPIDPACFAGTNVTLYRTGPRRTGFRGIVAIAPIDAMGVFSIPVGPVAPGKFAAVLRSNAQPSEGSDDPPDWTDTQPDGCYLIGVSFPVRVVAPAP